MTLADPVPLARFQFGFTIALHIIFPALSIGLGSYLAVLKGLWLATGQERFIRLFRYWMKAFALSFGVGGVSGLVMSYEFGTNWSVLSDKAGPIIGPLMSYEILTAFFLEAGFLGVMLFGFNRVHRLIHFGATLLIANEMACELKIAGDGRKLGRTGASIWRMSVYYVVGSLEAT